MPRASLIARFAAPGLAAAGVALAIAIAVGAVAVPDLAGTVSDGTRTLGAWIYVAVLALIFLETTALVGFVIHGELVLLVAGVRPSGATPRSRSSSPWRGSRRSSETS